MGKAITLFYAVCMLFLVIALCATPFAASGSAPAWVVVVPAGIGAVMALATLLMIMIEVILE